MAKLGRGRNEDRLNAVKNEALINRLAQGKKWEGKAEMQVTVQKSKARRRLMVTSHPSLRAPYLWALDPETRPLGDGLALLGAFWRCGSAIHGNEDRRYYECANMQI